MYILHMSEDVCASRRPNGRLFRQIPVRQELHFPTIYEFGETLSLVKQGDVKQGDRHPSLSIVPGFTFRTLCIHSV